MAEPDLSCEPDEVLAKFASSDPACMTELYLRYRPRVEHYCRQKLNDPHQVDDITATVFVKVLEALRRAPVQRFRPWLFTIVHNEIVSAYRSAHADSPLESHLALFPDHAPAADYRDDLDYVRSLLPCLTDAERHVIELRLFGLTNSEICQMLNKSYSWVAATQHRAFTRLHKLVLASTRAETCQP